jgi:pimeloyl-ACP methyl ester carboxylesterase
MSAGQRESLRLPRKLRHRITVTFGARRSGASLAHLVWAASRTRPQPPTELASGIGPDTVGVASMKTVGNFSAAATVLILVGCASSPTSFRPVDSFSAAKSHFAPFGTNRVHYLTAGKGRGVMVFVHGWSCNATFWREQEPAFADKARLILIDLPGHGQSDKPHDYYTMDFFASSVLAVLRHEHVSRAILVGHSMGVAVICRVHAQAPEKVSGLVAVDGFLRTRRLPREQSEKFIAPYRGEDYREQVKKSVNAMFPFPGTEALRDSVMSEMLATPHHVILSMVESPWDPTQPVWDLENVKVPVLVINSKSPFYPPEYETYVRSLSARTDYRTFDGVGHFSMLEKPALFNQTLAEMLREFDLLAR